MKLNKLKLAGLVSIPVILIGFQNCSKVGTNGIAVNDKMLSTDAVEVIPPASSTASGQSTPQQPGQDQQPGQNQQPPSSSTGQPVVSDPPSSSQPPVSSQPPASSQPPVSSQPPASNEQPPASSAPAANDPSKSGMPTADNDDDDKHKSPADDKDPDKNQMPASNDQSSPGDVAAITPEEVADAAKACEEKPVGPASENLKLRFHHEQTELNAENVESIDGNHGMAIIKATKDDSKVGKVMINHSTLVLCNFKNIQEIKGPHNRIIVVGGKIQELKVEHSEVALVNASAEDVKGSHSVVKVTYSLK